MKRLKNILILIIISSCNIFTQNWFPLEVGNKWHLINYSVIQIDIGVYQSGYKHEFREVLDSTIINGNKYFYLNSFFGFTNSTPIRYDSASKQILVYMNNNDNLFMDFSSEDSTIIEQILPNGTFTEALIKSSQQLVIDDTLNVKGFFRKTENLNVPPYYKWGYYYFAANIGFVFQDEYPPEAWPDNIWTDLWTGEYLIKLPDSINHKKHNYDAEILFEDVFIPSGTNLLEQHFKIMHPYSYYTLWWGDTYIDSTYLESFYKNNEDTIWNPDHPINPIDIVNFSLENFTIDTTFYLQGYKLYYRIIAKDRGIIPTCYFKPDSGYYQLRWGDSTTTINRDELITSEFALHQNYPNPFNPVTKIKFTIPNVETHRDASLPLVLKVFDVLGREVTTLVNEEKQPGVYEVEFQSSVDGKQLASGIYYYRLKAGDFAETKKMILIR